MKPPVRRARRWRAPALLAIGVWLGLLVASPSAALASKLTWGANLRTPNYDTANGDYSKTEPNGNPTPGADHAITPQQHQSEDMVIWNTAGSDTATQGGQVLHVKVEGCAWNDPNATGYPDNESSAGTPPNTINFQSMNPTGGGSYNAPYTAAGFKLPWCSDSRNPANPAAAVNTSTVTTFEPIHLCISQGGTVGFYDIGGYIPSSDSYPNGVPFLVIAGNGSANGFTLNSYAHAENAQGSGGGSYSSSSSNFGVEPNEELMLQVVQGTGDDAYGLCPGGKANEPDSNSNHITCVYDSSPEPGYTSCNGSGSSGGSTGGNTGGGTGSGTTTSGTTPKKCKKGHHRSHGRCVKNKKHRHRHKRHAARLVAGVAPF